jgi:hypothetical protein
VAQNTLVAPNVYELSDEDARIRHETTSPDGSARGSLLTTAGFKTIAVCTTREEPITAPAGLPAARESYRVVNSESEGTLVES